MICKNCQKVMLFMMNTTRPMLPDNSIIARYLCTFCGTWGIARYELTSMEWEEMDNIIDIDSSSSDEIYFVGNHPRE
jgi:RNase P subunit RPR2